MGDFFEIGVRKPYKIRAEDSEKLCQRGKEDFCMGKDYGPFAVKLDEMEEQCRRLMGRVRL